jgi:hypothetical protein
MAKKEVVLHDSYIGRLQQFKNEPVFTHQPDERMLVIIINIKHYESNRSFCSTN